MTPEQFEKYTNWQDKTFPKATEKSKVAHLKQEIDELFDTIQSHYSNNVKRLEYADCFLLLFGAAKKAGLTYQDICNAIDEKMTINQQREWGKPDENGVVNHIKN